MDEDLFSLASRLGEALLRERGIAATAESCTGGWVAATITAIAGSSAWFDRAFVTYSNEAKQELLGVRPATLARAGAVSEDTAREMAAGAMERSRATIAVAITGVAGPGGGSRDKPVGTVCFAWSRRDGEGHSVETLTRCFEGDRESVRRQSVILALEGMLERLSKPQDKT